MSILDRIISAALRGRSDQKHEEFVAQVQCLVPPQEFEEHKHLLNVLRPDSEWPVDHRREFLSILMTGVGLRAAFTNLDQCIEVGLKLGISTEEALYRINDLRAQFSRKGSTS